MIQVFGSAVGQEEIAEVSECIHRSWLGLGPKVGQFEKAFAERLGLKNFLMLDSGSNALYMAVTLLDLPGGSEIILPSFTWVSCAHAIILAGHRPVFCDVELETQNVSCETIRPHITPRTGAIMVVHYAGKPVDVEPILELGYPVIEDAAHAVDSPYKGRACGSIGDIGIYSFDPVKNLTTGGGGGITCRDDRLFKVARQLRYCGIEKSGFEAAEASLTGTTMHRWWEHRISEVFIKALPSDLNAGIGLAQLAKLSSHQQVRATLWNTYQAAFQGVDWIERPVEPSRDERHSYFTYLIRVPRRDALARYLLEKGIYTTLRFHPLHLNPIYKADTRLPACEVLSETGLNIPLHTKLSAQDAGHVIQSVVSFYES